MIGDKPLSQPMLTHWRIYEALRVGGGVWGGGEINDIPPLRSKRNIVIISLTYLYAMLYKCMYYKVGGIIQYIGTISKTVVDNLSHIAYP